ncbi:hypothetical protein PTKIN_Ptkin02bG0093400 [Pterospermum kingtungense]
MGTMDLEASSFSVPQYELASNGSGKRMPVLGFGTATSPPVEPEATKTAVLAAIKVGYRHFDTATKYGSEEPLGEAIQEALSIGLIQSRDELFITTKLWCGDAHGQLVVPALKRSLQKLKLEYLDLFLIHWPVSAKPGTYEFPIKEENFLPMDFKSVWGAMEDCQRLGLTKYIGVSNFTCKKLKDILNVAKIPPAVNQVEMNPLWQQKKLKEFCLAKGIFLTAYSPLGANGTTWGDNRVLECEVLKEIARAEGKTVAQVSLRWAYEQGVGVIVKSFNGERMKQNLEIFDWSLDEEDLKKIDYIPQNRGVLGLHYISKYGPYKTVEEMWDGEL